ncbi:hypothetical protein XMG59_000765 [Marinobacterium sp. xm-g-59]|jgi:hypothetical protein|uniref:hypothetical protein n=1 Tax=Marinobacterium sp. xm-g-59 TaxID=2497748 RepID=UPI0015681BC7|nr:hypothetical protein [Marinobacterium sp. xm-g-59]NRP94676.1 hypothetical protein [Marinobacterium sp. xm-g-59]
MIISHRIKNQKGIATLVTVVVLLIATTITAFTISSSIINEKQVVADEIRAAKAFEAARSGFASAVNQLRSTSDLPLEASKASGSISGAAESWSYWRSSSKSPLVIYATGESDDASVLRRIQSQMAYTEIELPEVSVVTAGVISASGGMTIINTQGNFTIWSGGASGLTGSASTWVPALGSTTCTYNTTNFNPDPVSCQIGTGKSGSETYIGADVIDQDPQLSGLSESDFQRAFLGKKMSSFCTNWIDVDGKSDSEIQTLADAEGSKVCLFSSGDNTISPNLVLGSPSEPKALIIDGDFEVNSNARHYGVMYVDGDINSANGSAAFFGTLIVRGAINIGKGGFTVVFDSSLTSIIGDESNAGVSVGTWRDW